MEQSFWRQARKAIALAIDSVVVNIGIVMDVHMKDMDEVGEANHPIHQVTEG